jgi:uncharacterized protein (DUF58 family)
VPGGAGPAVETGTAARLPRLSALTTRGRSFLAAGVAAVACAYVLGQPELLRVGLLLAALPLLCLLTVGLTRHRIGAARRLAPSRVAAASEARVHLRVENPSRVPTGLLMLQDRVPYVLGPRPRFVLDRVEGGGHREVSYRVRSDLRGRYPLGPLQLRLTDPFGMCEMVRSFRGSDTLTVLPRTEELPPTGLGEDATGHGEAGRRAAPAAGGEDDVIPRDYRHGDDLRRVHWPSTAKYGELMVRGEEQPHRARCTVLLDTRRAAFHGGGPDSAFEWAVSGAASVCAHLLAPRLAGGDEFTVRLLTDTGATLPGTPGSARLPGVTGAVGYEGQDGQGLEGAEAAALLLDVLAVLDHSQDPDSPGGAGAPDAEAATTAAVLASVEEAFRWQGAAVPGEAPLPAPAPRPVPRPGRPGAGLAPALDALRADGGEGLLVAFFGDLDVDQAALAAAMPEHAETAVAFVLSPAHWAAGVPGAAGPDPAAGAAGAGAARLTGLLRAGGWTVLEVRPGDTMAALWSRAGSGREGAGVAPGAGGFPAGARGWPVQRSDEQRSGGQRSDGQRSGEQRSGGHGGVPRPGGTVRTDGAARSREAGTAC